MFTHSAMWVYERYTFKYKNSLIQEQLEYMRSILLV